MVEHDSKHEDESAPRKALGDATRRRHFSSPSLLTARQMAALLLTAFGGLLVLVIAVGHLGLRRMDTANANLEQILGRHWAKLQLSNEALTYSNRNSRITIQVFLANDREVIAALLATRAENSKKISGMLQELQARCESEEEKEHLRLVEAARWPYVESYLQALHLLLDEGRREEAVGIMLKKTTPALVKYHAAWDEFMRFQMEQIDLAAHQSQLQYTRARRLSLLLIVAAAAMAGAIGLFAARKIVSETSIRIQAEREIKKLNTELEQRVSERTRELANTNERLMDEVHERLNAEQQVQYLAYYDALTGLPNRTLLNDRMKIAMASARRRGERLAILFLDLDNFKDVNDSLGHSVGDLLLKEVAERLKGRTREQDTVARLGGDEFVIVLSSLGQEADAAITAERIIGDMGKEFAIAGYQLSITCSLGICVFPDHATDLDALVKNADSAMYAAKENGRNNFQFYTSDMNAHASEKLALENGLRHALERNELFLVYQPQVDIESGNITGSEALLRWQHPELGLIPPDKFIPIAESSGMIMAVGEWVLRTACLQAKQWQSEGLPSLPVSVNVSPMQFRQKGFAQLVQQILAETELAPQNLELELTEGLIISSAEVVLRVLRDLKEMGVRLSIDDFGTGYSNLSYLRQFPVYRLKIDRSFVRDIPGNPDDASITSAIISMAKSLNLRVIAEGVESEAQMAFLRQHHCDEFQGYYFSKPLSPDQFAEHLRRMCMAVS